MDVVNETTSIWTLLLRFSIEAGIPDLNLARQVTHQIPFYIEYQKPPVVIKPDEIELGKIPRFIEVLERTITKDEILSILKEFILFDVIHDFLDTFVSLKRNAKELKESFQRVKKKGLNIFLKEIIETCKHLPSELKSNLNEFLAWIKTLTKKELLQLCIKIAFFSLATYLGYKIPDLDISILGIGSHRNFIFHSIIPAIGVRLTVKLINRFLDHFSKNCTNEDQGLKEAVIFLKDIGSTISTGIMLGVSVHLFQDLFIDGSQAIRGPWEREMIPDILRENYRFDDGYLLVNQLAGCRKLWK